MKELVMKLKYLWEFVLYDLKNNGIRSQGIINNTIMMCKV
jgi:hypothetical protein